MYGSTTYSTYYDGCFGFPFSGSYFSSKTTYINTYSGTPTGYDIAYQQSNGSIWMATDNATSPVACFQATSGGILASLPASIGIGSSCRGLAFETGSSQYLWVSNSSTDELYRVDLSTAVEDETSQGIGDAPVLSCGQNPFRDCVTLFSSGIDAAAVLQIFDVSGRTVLEDAFQGAFAWDARGVPSGPYFVVVRVNGEPSATLRLMKL